MQQNVRKRQNTPLNAIRNRIFYLILVKNVYPSIYAVAFTEINTYEKMIKHERLIFQIDIAGKPDSKAGFVNYTYPNISRIIILLLFKSGSG